MDPKSQLAFAVIGACAFAANAALSQASPPLKEASWLAGDHRFEGLASEPASTAKDIIARLEGRPQLGELLGEGDWRSRIELGEFLFKNPFVFGGQAAKAGLSCHSCHVNGRGNPAFQFPGVSGEPGTADISHSFFSKSLGNGTFDPVPIPDLALVNSVDHDVQTGALEEFIATIILDEFAGDTPPSDVIPALVTYVRAVRLTRDLHGETRHPRSPTRDLEEAAKMVEEARARLTQSPELSRLLLAGARHRMSLIHERIVASEHRAHRKWLIDRAQDLGSVQRSLTGVKGSTKGAETDLEAWLDTFTSRPDFASIEAKTLYNRETLESLLQPG